MTALDKELQSRRAEIKNELELLFKTNMKITDWDVPEVDDHAAAQMLVEIMQEALDELKESIKAGNYDYY